MYLSWWTRNISFAGPTNMQKKTGLLTSAQAVGEGMAISATQNALARALMETDKAKAHVHTSSGKRVLSVTHARLAALLELNRVWERKMEG